MSTTNFKVGQKVVCVGKFNGYYSNGEKINCKGPDPVKGGVYIVDAIRDDAPAIYLEGFDYITDYGFRVSFAADHFRPLTYKSCSAILAASVLTTETSDMPITNPSPKPETIEV